MNSKEEAELLRLYEDMTEQPEQKPRDCCEDCKIPLITMHDQSIKSCPNCGLSEHIMIQVIDHTDFDRCRYKKYTKYHRSMHLKNILKLLTCRKRMKTLDTILIQIKEYLKVFSMTEQSLSKSLIRNILRRLNLSKYYRYIHTIHSTMTRNKPYHLTDYEIKRINELFQEVEESYNRYKPKNRKSFLSYNFVLNKLFHKIERPDLAYHFPLLIGHKHMRFHNNIWDKICKNIS